MSRIELRWYTRKGETREIDGIEFTEYPRVLQYREWGKGLNKEYQGWIGWSDWKDIPEEKENGL